MIQGTGGAAYYLICAALGLAVLGMAAGQWRRLGAADYARLAAAGGGILAARLVGLVVLVAGIQPGAAILEWIVECLAVIAVTWALLFKAFPSRGWAMAYLITAAAAAVGLLVASLLVVPGTSWAGRAWPALLLLLSGIGLGQWARLRGQLSPRAGGAFAAAAVGAGLGLAGLDLVAAAGHLAALALVLLTAYDVVVSDLSAYGRELQTMSEEALRQTRELAFLLEVSQAVAASLNLPVVLDRISESVTLAMNSKWTYILLAVDGNNDELAVAARYGWIGRWQSPAARSSPEVLIRLAEVPLLHEAFTERRQIVANHAGEFEQLAAIHSRLGRSQAGPTIIQPIHVQDRGLGLILVGRRAGTRDRGFEEVDERLCQALAAQVATAIDNARLYQSVNQQARRLAELLRVREEELTQRQAILESITDGVVVAGDAGQVVVVNPAAERILGLSRDQLIGQAIKRLYTELLWASGRRLGDQAVLQWGHKVVKGSLGPVKMPDGAVLGYVAVLRDVTREQQAEEAKSQFIATISHELRTPMTSIKGYTDLIAAEAVGSVNPQQRRFLEIVRANAEQMIGLVNNLIAVSEMDQGPIQIEARPLDMGQLLADAVDAVRCQAEERELDVVLNLPAGLSPVLGDRQRLRQIVDNVLDNACRYTPAGGRITVWAAEARLEDKAGFPTHCVVVNVRDTGVGIAREEQARIFEKFYRAENPLSIEAGGTGVGLTIAKSLVEAHGGRIWVESAPDVGSTFTFVVPVAATP